MAVVKPVVLPQVFALCAFFVVGIGALVGYMVQLIGTARQRSAEIEVARSRLDAIITMDHDGGSPAGTWRPTGSSVAALMT